MKKYSKKQIQDLIDNMSLEAKVGQLFLLAYPGKNPEVIRPLIEKYGICGCYISQDNADTFEEARDSAARLQEMSLARVEEIPLLLGVDQEGAWGILVPESHTGPGNLALGALADKKNIVDMYAVFAKEMLSVGYNALLGPCADVNIDPLSPIIGTRSFGEYPARVAECVVEAVKGAREQGILTTLKHFPGHGGTSGDTHREIPCVDKSLELLSNEDLLPFAEGIKAGADIVMTSHILYPQLDPEYPATLSSIILEKVLRKDLGFDGVILSDSMNMGAIRKFYDPAQSTVMALKAGVDIVMLSEEHYDHSDNYLSKQLASLDQVKKAIEEGELFEQDVDKKLFRILNMKLNKMLVCKSKLEKDDVVNNFRIEHDTAKKSIILLRQNLWPLPEEGQILCINATPRSSYQNLMNSRGIGPNQEKPGFDSFKETLSALDSSIQFLDYEDLEAGDRSFLGAAAAVIAVSEDYPLPGEDFEKEKQQSLIKGLAAEFGAKMIILGLRSSYEMDLYPEDVTYLCSFSSRECSARVLAEILISRETDFTAKSPVSI